MRTFCVNTIKSILKRKCINNSKNQQEENGEKNNELSDEINIAMTNKKKK